MSKIQTKENVIITALKVRLAGCLDFGLVSQINQLSGVLDKANSATFDYAQNFMVESDFNYIADRISYIDDTGTGKDQVKTIVKMVKLIEYIATKIDTEKPSKKKSALAFTKDIAQGYLDNGNTLSVSEGVVTLSRKANAVFSGDVNVRVRESVKSENGYSINTGGSQTSQVRCLFAAFNMFKSGTYSKGKNADMPELSEYGVMLCKHIVATAQ